MSHLAIELQRREIAQLKRDLYKVIEILRDCGAFDRLYSITMKHKNDDLNEILDRLGK